MKMKFVRRFAAVLAIVTVMAAAGCSTSQVANTTGNAVGAATRGTVHVVAGAGRLAGQGVSSAYGAFAEE